MNESSHPARDSSVAAALHALMPGGDPDFPSPSEHLELLGDDTQIFELAPEESADERLVYEACRALAVAGLRPKSRNVVEFLTERDGSSPERSAVAPLIRRWRAAQWKSSVVRAAFQAYALLDAEQRLAFKLRAEVDDACLAAAGDSPDAAAAPFELRIHFRGGRTRSELADRATIAWVKFENLIDRHLADVVRLELVEKTPDGERILRKWKTGSQSIATWADGEGETGQR
ncbi:MAG TPA: hypothetical protein VNT79_07230 [Phycisphaerae bacterium]|nr:hypothetical protein [Phycisphaerae bacterium]